MARIVQSKEKELKKPQNKEISPIPKALAPVSKRERPINSEKRPFTQQLSQKNMRKSLFVQQEISQNSEFLSPKAGKSAAFTERKPSHLRVKTESTAFSGNKTEVKHFWLKKPNYTVRSTKNFQENSQENYKEKAVYTQDDYQLSESIDLLQETYKNNEGNEENNENFAKFKYLYKYPFKEFEEYGIGEEENRGDLDTNEEFFKRIYREMRQKHESCGPECGHLKRFYHRIRFMGKFLRKKEMEMQKKYIDKLPLENSN